MDLRRTSVVAAAVLSATACGDDSAGSAATEGGSSTSESSTAGMSTTTATADATGMAATSSGPDTSSSSTASGSSSSSSTGTADDSTTSTSGTSTGSTGRERLEQGAACRAQDECLAGNCVDGVCCDQPCEAACDVCAWDLGASEDGVCGPAPFTGPASDACGPQTCDGTGGDCVDLCISEVLSPVRRPADFIFVVDNSGSMSEEAAGLEANVNTSFAQELASANIDYRVTMVANHGTASTSVCIAPPLSGTTNCAGPPISIAGQFAHYDVDVQSHDGLCILLDTLFAGEADEWNLFPAGWNANLRPEALKIFVALTDDGTQCTWNGTSLADGNTDAEGQTAALAWEQELLASSPLQFGTVDERNYVVHGILGVEAADGDAPAAPYLPGDAVALQECTPGAVDPGTAYQWLAKNTGGLRFPLCDPSNYDEIFERIVEDTVDQVVVDCQYRLPTLEGEVIDSNNVRLTYTPPAAEAATYLPVASADDCGVLANAFYIDGETVHLCPDTCSVAAAEPDGVLELQALCE